MNKLLLIDGSGLLVSNYYGTLPKSALYGDFSEIYTIKDYYANALYPTIKQIFEIAINANVTHISVAFDKSRNTFRKEISEDYKANRKETPNPLKEQFVLCEYILQSMGINVLFDERYEADDIIGSISKQMTNDFDEIILLTKDKDYIQLVDNKSTVWMMLYKKEIADEKLKKYKLTKEDGYLSYLPDKVFPYTPHTVFMDKGIKAENFNHVLALAGDSADNIKGVRGISEEVAIKLISEYSTINELYEEIQHYNYMRKGKELKEYWKTNLDIKRTPFNALNDYKEDAFLSLELATIKTDIDLSEYNIHNFEISEYLKELKSIYTQDGFYKFRESIQNKIKYLIKMLPDKE